MNTTTESPETGSAKQSVRMERLKQIAVTIVLSLVFSSVIPLSIPRSIETQAPLLPCALRKNTSHTEKNLQPCAMMKYFRLHRGTRLTLCVFQRGVRIQLQRLYPPTDPESIALSLAEYVDLDTHWPTLSQFVHKAWNASTYK